MFFIRQVNTDNEIKNDGDVYGPHHWEYRCQPPPQPYDTTDTNYQQHPTYPSLHTLFLLNDFTYPEYNFLQGDQGMLL